MGSGAGTRIQKERLFDQLNSHYIEFPLFVYVDNISVKQAPSGILRFGCLPPVYDEMQPLSRLQSDKVRPRDRHEGGGPWESFW